ncbi:hypothetical protein [Hymenobacter sp. YC55]|uniref:hypothetical protein n=1 Tax=Hymenobacter sp. YC55 TaxID=3034019 RepID=UPI0023F8C5B5|nr:hypothetical protein [Hymenobacter sp. YC55]MDF7814742.1 hypothetical protein [Hymenobacter sp. YC55]
MSHDELKEDTLLGTLLREVDSTPALPKNFTASIMAAIEVEAAEQALLYEPLLSRQAWRGIILAVGLLLSASRLLCVLPFYAELAPDESGFGAWLSSVELLQPVRGAAPPTMGSHLLAAGGICLAYLLLDKWHSTYRRQRHAAKQQS